MAAPVPEIMDTPSYAKLQVLGNVHHNIDVVSFYKVMTRPLSSVHHYSPIQVLVIFVAVIFTD
jgi:hypothetical protein